MRNLVKALALGLVLSLMAGSAYCAQWQFYGKVKMQAFMYDSSKERKDFLNYLGTSDPYDNLQFKLDPYNSRIGAWVSNDDITGVFELRPYSQDVMRMLYGTWDFGAGELLIGKAYTPLNMFYSQAAAEDDNNMFDYGALWELRHPMIQVKLKGLTLALIQPGDEVSSFYSRATWAFENGTIETTWPKIEAKYTQEFGPARIDLYGGYNTYDFKLSSVDKTVSIDSYVLGAGLTLTFNDFKVSGATYYAINAGPMGLFQSVNYSNPELDANNEVLDNKSFGWLAVASYIINDTFRLEAGYSSLTTEIDDDAAWSKKDETEAYYFQVRISVLDNFFIVPEVGKIDYKTDYLGTDTGDKTYWGAKFEINF